MLVRVVISIIFAISSLTISNRADAYIVASRIVALDLQPRILHLALKAYIVADNKGLVKQPILTIIDYTKASTTNRMWIINMETFDVMYHTLVSHGSASGGNYARRFSNTPDSHKSSIGVFLTGKIYYGIYGRSLTLHGLEKEFNSNARSRNIVMHPAPYVSQDFIRRKGRLGKSNGCFAIKTSESREIIDNIANGSIIFAYYPLNNWLNSSTFLT